MLISYSVGFSSSGLIFNNKKVSISVKNTVSRNYKVPAEIMWVRKKIVLLNIKPDVARAKRCTNK